VKANGVDVNVLGTHFNVNAYADENSVKTTLLEGAVRVARGNRFTLLKPGNQSSVNKNGDMQLITSVNTEEAVAWKNGLFDFQSADIETIMRQVARWYDVDVEYAGRVNEKFYVELPRNTKASELFKMLETTGAVHFEIGMQKIKVLP
jgi:ferric-dicitrate binding protein FerR (iron transport regulator)